ncbi:hypothetical protein AB0E69_05680 [Kribbella sp. NPDC026611]|uniref:hypothetical protein n=1 Tax=Kribbella sp. NPDC026611 TaxID=3154911 RepID=UPI0033DAB71D
MSPDIGSDRSDHADAARRAVAGIAASAVGLALTPVVGPVGAAMAASGLVPIFEQIAAYDKQAAENAARVAQLGAEFAGVTPVDLGSWSAESPRRQALLANVVDAAWRFADEEKIVGLARLLADGIRDDARIDTDRLFVVALRDFEPAHIQVLRHMAIGGNPHDQPPARPVGAPQEWATEHVREALPWLAEGLDYLLATLDGSGCIATGTSRYGTSPWWLVTPFGHGLLKFLIDGSGSAISRHAAD